MTFSKEIEVRLNRMIFPTLAGMTHQQYGERLTREAIQAEREEDIFQADFRRQVAENTGRDSTPRGGYVSQ